MKKYVTIMGLAFVLALFLPLNVSGQRSRSTTGRLISPENISVSLSLTSAPRIGHDKQSGEQRVDHKWLMVRVLYKFDGSFRDGFTFDDLRCEVYLHTRASSSGWRRNYWFTGTQYFYSVIPGRAGTVHRVTVFMPPALVYKCFRSSKLSAKALRDCDVVVRLYNADRLLGMKLWSGNSKGGKMDRRYESGMYSSFRRMNDMPANKVVNGLWPREKTPWQWLDANIMDLPRVTFEKEPSGAVAAVRPEETGEEQKDPEEADSRSEGKKDDSVAEEEKTEFTRSSRRKNRNKRGKK